jgi:hypothetical protein
MTLAETLVEVWRQTLVEAREDVEFEGAKYSVTRTRHKGLRAVSFSHEGDRFEGIEQNPETKSRWAALARAGKRIMQFSYRGRYIGNVCEGTLMRYPGWKSAGLGD